MVCRNERLASKSARSRGKKKSFEMVVEGCWDDLTVEYQPPSALSKRICRSLQRATIICSPTVRTGFAFLLFLMAVIRKKWWATIIMAVLSTYPLLQRLTGSLDPMATLDHIRLEAYWPWRTVKFQEETAGIAKNGTELVPSPEWCCRSGTILTYRLERSTIMVSKYRHHFCVD